jgi:hypothetical protein
MRHHSLIILALFLALFIAGPAAAQSHAAAKGRGADRVGPVVVLSDKVAVTTYHYDNLRTGWNPNETMLTAAKFPSPFGMLASVTLDDQVDAQPLIVPNQTIFDGTKHDVVYVATASNTVYAIDASTGAILYSRNLGPPVPTPLGCQNNGPNVGITGTPVIDLATQTLYVIAYVNGFPPIYQLHALDLGTLNDSLAPVTVAASHALVDGSTFTFDATYERQRPALIESNGNVYAGFGSFCDFNANQSRGWLLGWNASTLAPLSSNQLDDRQTNSDNFFLSSIWMSGYGIAGSGTDLYFTTGNSDPGTYDGTTNIQESVVWLKGDLTSLRGIFTPPEVDSLDAADADLGSGGVLLLPSQALSQPHLAVAEGKDGRLFLLQRQKSGGLTVVDTQQLSGCLCGPSYFTGPDGVNRIVTSDSATSGFLNTWQVNLSPTAHLTLEGSANFPSSLQDNGFFTVVSSNGTTEGSPIIWAVGRPTDPATTYVTLYAFSGTANSDGTITQLFSAPAGTWPNIGGNANIVPVAANGKVYVASYQTLTIFGDTAISALKPTASVAKITLLPRPSASPDSHRHVVSGNLVAVSGSTLTLETREGKTVKIDASQALKNRKVGTPLKVGIPLTVLGSSLSAVGALEATAIMRAKGSSGQGWPLDR